MKQDKGDTLLAGTYTISEKSPINETKMGANLY